MIRKNVSMKRLVPLAAILAIPIGAHTPASASPARPAPMAKAVASELTQLKHARNLQVRSVMHRLRDSHIQSLGGATRMNVRAGQAAPVQRFVVSHGRSNTSGSDLALPPDVLSAGNGTQGSVTSANAPFRVFHTNWTGFASGVGASFNFEPVMDLFYQGSVFTSAGSAQAYMNESYNHLASGNAVPPNDCSGTIGYPCKIIGYETTDGLAAVYSVAQINYCVIETGYQGDPDQINANLDTVSKAAAGVFDVGVTEAETACTSGSSNPPPTAQPTAQPTARPTQAPTQVPTQVPTSLEVVGCFQKKGTKLGSSPTCLHKAKRGQKVLLVAYTTVESAPVGSNASVAVTVKRGSSTVRKGTGSFTTDSADNLYYVYGSWTLPRKKGTYALHAQTTMNGVTVSDDEKLTVS